MTNDKPYYEGFFAVQIKLEGVMVAAITQEQYEALENTVAEVNIPYNTPEAGYCMIAILIDLPHEHIAVGEMLVLKSIVADVVSASPEQFKRVG